MAYKYKVSAFGKLRQIKAEQKKEIVVGKRTPYKTILNTK